VIWDRLGKAGRCLNPKKQHYNPEARRLIEEANCDLTFLPPKGKYFNPIELSFGWIKDQVRKSYSNSDAAAQGRPRNAEEINDAVQDAADAILPFTLSGFFRERAGTRAFASAYPTLVDKVVV
jgi:hypothetical protein